MYYKQLKRYFDMFEKDQIKVYLYEDFKNNPIGIMQDIFRFLKVDDSFIPDISVNYKKTIYEQRLKLETQKQLIDNFREDIL